MINKMYNTDIYKVDLSYNVSMYYSNNYNQSTN